MIFPHAAVIAATAAMRRNSRDAQMEDLRGKVTNKEKLRAKRELACFESINRLTPEEGEDDAHP